MQAGRCATCDAIVWCDESGNCEVGGPQHAVVERWAVDESDIPVGRGPLPESLRSFNWPAFLMPVLWPLVRGFGWIAGVLFLTNILYIAASFTDAYSFAPVLYAAAGVHLLVFTGAGLWLGMKGSALYWHRRDPEVPASPRTVGEYLHQQRTWLWVGLALYGWNIFAGVRAALSSQTVADLIRGPLYYVLSIAAAVILSRALAAKPSGALVEAESAAGIHKVAKMVGLVLLVLVGILGAALALGLV